MLQLRNWGLGDVWFLLPELNQPRAQGGHRSTESRGGHGLKMSSGREGRAAAFSVVSFPFAALREGF